MTQDPVCKMTVDENSVADRIEHKGKTYYFCAAGCKETFAKETDKYVEQSSGHEHSHC